jgi:hypothetical protein
MLPGQKVKTLFGEIETITKVDGCRAWTKQNKGGWYHVSKVWPVVWSEKLQRWITEADEKGGL